MGIIESVKDILVPETEEGIALECVECGTRYDPDRERCPECGAVESKEVGGFEMRPSS
jgi:uncharacterized OB-fold protein